MLCSLAQEKEMWKHFLTFYLKLPQIEANIVPFVFVWVDFYKCQATRRILQSWYRAELDETAWEVVTDFQSCKTSSTGSAFLYREQFWVKEAVHSTGV